MSTNFPTALDTLTNPTPTDYLNSPSHAGQHANANDAIEAIETYIGVAGGETSLLIKMLKAVYPVGSAYFNYSNATNPATLLGFGTWVAAAVGRTIVGIDAAQTEFDTAGETGGAKTHTLTSSESGLRAHNHPVTNGANQIAYVTSGGNGNFPTPGTTLIGQLVSVNNNSSSNASSAHNNLQPYEVWYIWRRTA